MKKFWALFFVAFGGFLVGVGCVLVLAKEASHDWVSLSYVFLAEELRMDAGKAASVANWPEADRDFATVLKIKGREGDPWPWYFPLVAWSGGDYTTFPSGSHRDEDLAFAAYVSAKSGDVSRAEALYAELLKLHPEKRRETWEAFAASKLKVSGNKANGEMGVAPLSGVAMDRSGVPIPGTTAGR